MTATTSTPVGVFARLTGQEAVAEELLRAARDPASMTHAWLFTGPPGSGRSLAARAFAAALQCESGPAEGGPGCGRCQACQTVLAGSHPDLVVESTTGTFILVGRARELAQQAARRPVAGRWRVIVVEDADRLNDQAADALLKSLEEPPERTVWLLCAPSLEDLLVTIRSRCRHVRLRTPPVDAVAALLVAEGVDAPMAHYAARAAQSHIGIARRLARDEAARARRREVIAIPASLTDLGAALSAAEALYSAAQEDTDDEEQARARRAYIADLGGDPDARVQPPAIRAHLKAWDEDAKRASRRRQHDAIDAALTDLASVYRDALVLGSGAPVEPVNATEPELVDRVRRAFTPEELLRALDAINLARQRLVANGAPLLVLEAMMISLIHPRASGDRG